MNNLDLNAIEQEALPNFNFSGGSIGSVVGAALPYIFFFAGLMLLIYTISGGYSLMFSAGDPKAIAAGRSRVTAGLIGFIIVFSAYWIVQLTGTLLGLEQIQGAFGGNRSNPLSELEALQVRVCTNTCTSGQLCVQPSCVCNGVSIDVNETCN